MIIQLFYFHHYTIDEYFNIVMPKASFESKGRLVKGRPGIKRQKISVK